MAAPKTDAISLALNSSAGGRKPRPPDKKLAGQVLNILRLPPEDLTSDPALRTELDDVEFRALLEDTFNEEQLDRFERNIEALAEGRRSDYSDMADLREDLADLQFREATRIQGKSR